MSRKSLTYTVTDEGRDKGKTFVVNEMSAADSEEWAARALFAAMNAGIEIPDEMLGAGLAGLAAVGIKALSRVPFEAVKPLFDQMMGCVQYMPDASRPNVVRPLIDDDIEEVATRLKLRKAALDLHLDFFRNAARSKPDSLTAAQTSAA